MKQNTDPSAVFDQQFSLAEQPPETIVWSQHRANWRKDVSRNFGKKSVEALISAKKSSSVNF
jgi:hypothetical protein